ncbi:hypothetical protein [Streptomyces sp. CC224B]|uniref:hypothetical protein n=1 Tax=Streptomyces sp. CC224B TaxID=3044571 RepID=UPI0024A8E40C|nr:hypothetical protein [Streptomyces sp. CC224B]
MTSEPPESAASVRDALLHALDFAYCNGLGYESPEALLDAYDAARAAAVPSVPADAERRDTDPELTAEEARALADDFGPELYRAQDALAFVEECCVIADREGRAVTTADVREWLKGARCGRQIAAAAELDQRAAAVQPPADRPVCVCGAPIEPWTGPGDPGWIHSPGSDTRCLDARPAPTDRDLRDHIADAVVPLLLDTLPKEIARSRGREVADVVLAVLPVPADRAAVLREAADYVGNDDTCTCGGCDTCVPNKLAAGLRRMADEAQQAGEAVCRTPETHNWGCGCPTDPPHRGDKVDVWLRARREEYPHGTPEWHTVDQVLDRYRLHADTQTLLSEHLCEGHAVGDCDCLERQTGGQP